MGWLSALLRQNALSPRSPPPCRGNSHVLLRRQRYLAVLRSSNTLHLIIPSFFPFFPLFLFVFIFYFRLFPPGSPLVLGLLHDGLRHLTLALGSRHWMQHMCGSGAVQPEKRRVKDASQCFSNDYIIVTFLPSFGRSEK